MAPDELLLAGRIVAAHGIKGEVKIQSYVDETVHFRPGKEVLVELPGGGTRPFMVSSAQAYKTAVRMGFEAVDSRDDAEALIGGRLLIPRVELPPAEPDTWYWCDLIGLDVYDAADAYMGRLASIIETGSNDVFVVQNEHSEVLIPAISSVVIDIDLEAGRMKVDLPEGL